MASAAKGKASKVAVWIILVLLIIGLAGFGATNFGGSNQAVGSVGDQDVTVQDYARALQEDLNAFQAQTGQSIPLATAQAFGLDRNVLQRLLSTAALDNETQRLGVSVGDAEVRDQLLQMRGFQGLDGEFDRDTYARALDRANLTEGQFEDSLRLDAARVLLQGAVAGGIAPQSTLTDTMVSYIAETRNFTWARVSASDLITGAPVPEEADLRAYYDENPAEFTAPETRKISYVALTPDMVIDQVQVDEEALKAIYAERESEFNRPERRLVERLVFPSDEEAAAAKARLDSEEISFDTLVEERGLALSDVDMGDVTQAELDGAGEAIFALADPGVAGPLPSPLGPALFRMNAILPALLTTYEDARPELFDELALDGARRLIADEITAIDDLLAGGATLEEVGEETPMTFGQLDWNDQTETDLAGYEAFRSEAGRVTVDDFPEVRELDDGGIFALRLDEIVPPTLRPYEEVTEAVTAAWESQDLTRRVAALATDLSKSVTADSDIAALGVTATEEADLARDAFIEETPADMMAQVFEMDAGEVRVIEGREQAFILRLDGINAADSTDPETALVARAVESQTAQSMTQDIFQAFTNAVQSDAGITINQSAINAVHAQFP